MSVDVAWAPEVPTGHTPFSWYGGDEAVPEEKELTPHASRVVEQKSPPAEPAAKQADKPKEEPAKPAAKEAGKEEPKPKKEKSKEPKEPKAPKESAKQKKPGKAAEDQPVFSKIDIRVGKIVDCHYHENADGLYVENIDLGEDRPRQIVSGLRKYYTLEQMIGRRLLVIINLKASDLRGVLSSGMVLAAKNEDHTVVELIEVPEGAQIGERLNLEGLDILDFPGEHDVNPKKKGNAWAVVAASLKTNANREVEFEGKRLLTSAGPIVAATLSHSFVS